MQGRFFGAALFLWERGMTTGRRDQLVTLQSFSAGLDEYGEPTLEPTWSDIGQAWAQVFWGKGDERRQAAMEQGKQAATFQVLWNAATRAVNIRDRIVMDGGNFDIVGISPNVPDRASIEFTAVRAA
jgi:head-tail adaptor